MQQKNEKTLTWFDHLLGSLIAFPVNAVIYVTLALTMKVMWPVLRSIWTMVTGKVSAARPVVSKKNNLPTPDIFKDAPNLAPAKQLRL